MEQLQIEVKQQRVQFSKQHPLMFPHPSSPSRAYSSKFNAGILLYHYMYVFRMFRCVSVWLMCILVLVWCVISVFIVFSYAFFYSAYFVGLICHDIWSADFERFADFVWRTDNAADCCWTFATFEHAVAGIAAFDYSLGLLGNYRIDCCMMLVMMAAQ